MVPRRVWRSSTHGKFEGGDEAIQKAAAVVNPIKKFISGFVNAK
jgi:hypothetical protein